MKKPIYALGSLGLTFAAFMASAPAAHAVTPASSSTASTPHEVSGFLGYGFDDVYRLSFGARYAAALDLSLPITLGAQFTYGFGHSVLPGVSVHSYQIAAEVGYDLSSYMPDCPVAIRPYVGLGLLHATQTVDNGFGTGDSSTDFLFAPGVTAEYPMGNFFVGGDARIPIVSDHTSFELFANIGSHF